MMAIFSNRNLTIGTFPASAAQWRALRPCLTSALISVPCKTAMRTVVTDSNAGGWGKGGKGGQERGWVGVIKPYSVNKLRVRGCIIILIITSTTATNQFCLGCPPPLQWHQMKICIHYRNKYCKQLSSYLIDQQILCHTILGPSCNIMQLQKYFQSIFNDFSFLRVLGLSCCTRGLQMN